MKLFYKIVVLFDDESLVIKRTLDQIVELLNQIQKQFEIDFKITLLVDNFISFKTSASVDSYFKERNQLCNDSFVYFLNECCGIPCIISSSLFKEFLFGNQFSDNSEYQNYPTSVQLLLQSQELIKQCIPWNEYFCVDIEAKEKQTLIWKFDIESRRDLNFGIVICSHDPTMDAKIKASYLDKYITDTCILTKIDFLHSYSDPYGIEIQVLEPLSRINQYPSIYSILKHPVELLSHSQSSHVQLQSSIFNSDGSIDGFYSFIKNNEKSNYTCRFLFDNSVEKLSSQQKYINYCVQAVDYEVMQAAIRAASELKEKSKFQYNKLFEKFINSQSIEFSVHGPWDVEEIELIEERNLDKSFDQLTPENVQFSNWLSHSPLGKVLTNVIDSISTTLPLQQLKPLANKSFYHDLTISDYRFSEIPTSDESWLIPSPIHLSSQASSPIDCELHSFKTIAVQTEPMFQNYSNEQCCNSTAVQTEPINEISHDTKFQNYTKEQCSIAVQAENISKISLIDKSQQEENILEDLSSRVGGYTQYSDNDLRKSRIEEEIDERLMAASTKEAKLNQILLHNSISREQEKRLQIEAINQLNLMLSECKNVNNELIVQLQKSNAEKKLLRKELLTLKNLGVYPVKQPKPGDDT